MAGDGVYGSLMRLPLLALALTAFPFSLFSADLDAPLKPAPPTIRSEIQRGSDAAADCGYVAVEEEEVRAFYACIDASASADRQRLGQNYEAFNAGLYYRALQHLRIVQQVWAKSSLPHDMDAIRLDIESESASYDAALTPLHITDEDVKSAFR